MTTVGSQDTTGPMTADELKELACLKFQAPMFMQSFCHTAAYPKPADVKMHKNLPGFIAERGGVALRPGDGVIHSWLNRLLLPDTVGTGGDSHTRFPIGISLPGRLRPGGLRRRHGLHAAGHARIGAGALQGQAQPRHHPARRGQRHPLLGHQAGAADRAEEEQDQHLQRPHPRDGRSARPDRRAGLRADRRRRRALRRCRLHPALRGDRWPPTCAPTSP